MPGLLNFKVTSSALTDARSTIDSLPGILEALGKVPAMVSAMPAAPVIIGAVSRMVATTIADELRARGPSAAFMDRATACGLAEDQARELFAAAIATIEAA